MWFANQTVVTSVLEDNVNTFVHFNDITLFCFEWTLNGLNLIVMGCDLGYTAISVSNKHKRGHIIIHNSTWGNIQTDNVQLKVSGCVISGYNRPKSALFNMNNSVIIFKYSYLYDFYLDNYYGSSLYLISATNTVVKMENIEEKNNVAQSLIDISGNSDMHIMNCVFYSDHIVLVHANRSSVSLTNCSFSLEIKTIFHLGTNASIKIKNCGFINSIAIAMSGNNNSVVLVEGTFNHSDITTGLSSNNTIFANQCVFLTGNIQI